ncbi:MAG: hypothetical protein ACLT2I_00480, partial [Corynebacterium variabile]
VSPKTLADEIRAWTDKHYTGVVGTGRHELLNLAGRVEQIEQERDYLAAEIDKANTDILHLTYERDEARAEVERLTAEDKRKDKAAAEGIKIILDKKRDLTNEVARLSAKLCRVTDGHPVARLVPAPRTVNSVAELDALPFRSVILSADDKNPDVYQRDSYDEWLDITAQGYSSSQVIRMERSVTVLYQPKEDQK